MEEFKKIENQQYIENLFRNLARAKEYPVLLNRGLDQTVVNLYFGDRHGDKVYLKLLEDSDSKFLSQVETEVSFVNKETLYLFNTKVLNNNGALYQIAKPTAIFTSFRRLVSRYRTQTDDAARLQFPQHKESVRIMDINTKGLAFISTVQLFKVGEILRNIKITIGNETELYVDGVIRHCKTNNKDSYIFGLNFIDLDWLTYFSLFNFIFSKNYPNLKPLGEFSIDQIYKLYEESGYLDLKSKEQMKENFTKMARNLEMIKSKSQIYTNPVYIKDDKLLSTASLLRIYDRTFLGHQLAASPESRSNIKSKFDIYLGFADFMLNHPYCQYHLAYFDAHLFWHLEMYKKINDYIGDPDKSIFDNIYLFELNFNEVDLNSFQKNNEYIINTTNNPREFIEYCQRELPKLENNCYEYNLEHFYLPETKQAFEMVGLYVDRRLWSIYDRGQQLIAYVVTEVYSDGLNLFNMLDMSRVYFVSKEFQINSVLKALLNENINFLRRYKKDKCNIVFKVSEEEMNQISIPGLKFLYLLGRVMMSCEGISEYKTILMSKMK